MTEYSSYNWTTKDNIDIHGYHGTSANPKAVVALVHGIGEHSERYKHVGDYLTAKGYAFAALDHRGHGQSTGKRGHAPSYDVFLEDVDEFLTKVRAFYPNKPIFLYGHSMGGNIVLNYLVRRKPSDLKGVITTGAFIKLAFEPSAFMVGLGKLMRNIIPAFSQKNQLVLEHISRSPEVVEAYQKDPLVHNKITATMGIGMLETARSLYTYKGSIKVPLLMMHGGADRITSPKGSARFAKNVNGNVTYKEWKGLFHEIHNEPEKEAVFEFLVDWMEVQLVS